VVLRGLLRQLKREQQSYKLRKDIALVFLVLRGDRMEIEDDDFRSFNNYVQSPDKRWSGTVKPSMIRIDGWVMLDNEGTVSRLDWMSFTVPYALDESQTKCGVVAIVPSQYIGYENCPQCKGELTIGRPVIILESYHVIPCEACSLMVWMDNSDLRRMRNSHAVP
jgi:hypothetical protein